MEKNEKLSTVDFISSLLVRYKILLIVITLVIAVSLIGLAVGAVVTNASTEKNAALAEEILDAYSELETAASEKKEEAAASFTELVAKGKETRKGSYAYVRAVLCESQMLETEDKKEEALNSLSVLCDLKSDLYLIPIALHRAAVLAEDLGKNDEALTYYYAVADHYGKTYFNMDRIYFNIGRLEELSGNNTRAQQIYSKLIDSASTKENSDSSLVSIARDRLIYLETAAGENESEE